MHSDLAASLAIPSASRLTLWKQASRQIEGLIRDGTLSPGQRLPEHTELARMIGVGASTLQRALSDLTGRGLLVRSPRRGTFVAGPDDGSVGERHVAILTRALYDPSLSRFDFLTARAVVDLLGGEKRPFKFYSDLTSASPGVAGKFNEVLAGDIEAGEVEGIIVLGSLSPVCDPLLALIARKKVPMVETSVEARPQNLVEFDMDAFYGAAAKLARESGLRSVGLVSTFQPGAASNRDGHDPRTMFDRHFGHLRPAKENALVASPEPTAAAYLRVGALAAARMAADLPEMVLVTDDYIAEGFVRKMESLGKRPPQDFRLVARGNAGADYPSLEGCEMVLFSPAELVAQAWSHLRSRMAGDRSNRVSVAIPPFRSPRPVLRLRTRRDSRFPCPPRISLTATNTIQQPHITPTTSQNTNTTMKTPTTTSRRFRFPLSGFRVLLILALSILPATLAPSVHAASASWNVTGGGNWNDNGNWSAAFPNSSSDVATLGSIIAANATITLGQNITVSNLTANSARSYVITGANTLSIGASGITNNNSGLLQIDSDVNLSGSFGIQGSGAGPITLNGVIGGSPANVSVNYSGTVTLGGTSNNTAGATLYVNGGGASGNSTVI